MPTVTIYSPINGTVVKRHTSPGERIDAAAPFFTIAELDPLWVELQVPAARLPNLTVGSRSSLPAQRARGKIIRIGRTVDPSTQSAIAVAEIGTEGTSVWPGLAVSATVIIGSQTAGADWSVPVQSVVRHRDRNWVFVRAPEGFPGAAGAGGERDRARRLASRQALAGDRVATSGIIALLADARRRRPGVSMLGRIIDVALKQRLLVFLGALALAVWGANAFLKLPIDAFPDVAPVQVLVAMRAPGLTPEELESRVTAPIEIAMRGIPNLAAHALDDALLRRADHARVRRRHRHFLGPRPGQRAAAGRARPASGGHRRRARADRDGARRNADVHDRVRNV